MKKRETLECIDDQITILERELRELRARRYPMEQASRSESKRIAIQRRLTDLKGDYQPGEAGSIVRGTG